MTFSILPATSCSTRRLAFGLAALFWLVATAASAQTKVVVGEVKGRGGGQVRAAIVRALQQQDEIELVSSSAVSSAESRMGVEAKGPERVDVSRALGVAAWIEGEVGKSRRGVDVSLVVINGATGETMTVMSYESKKPRGLANLTGESVWADLGPVILSAQAPMGMPPQDMQPRDEREPDQAVRPREEPGDEEAEEEQEPEEEAEPEEEPSQADDGERPSPLDVGIGLVGMSRGLEYNDDLSGLSTYHLDLGPSVALQARWYPVAHFESGVLANIGLDLRGRLMFAVDSGLGGDSYPTSSRALGLGLRGRLPLGEHELAAVVGYASQTFEIDAAKTDTGELESGVPGASYGMLRLGLEARFGFGDVHLGAAAAFLPVLSTGELERWFPRSSALGLEGELSVGYSLSPAFEVCASFGLQRIALSMNPELADVDKGLPIAGGAVDETLFGTVGARFYLGR